MEVDDMSMVAEGWFANGADFSGATEDDICEAVQDAISEALERAGDIRVTVNGVTHTMFINIGVSRVWAN